VQPIEVTILRKLMTMNAALKLHLFGSTNNLSI